MVCDITYDIWASQSMKTRHRNQDGIRNHATALFAILLLSCRLHSFLGESVYEEGSFWGAIQNSAKLRLL